MYFKHNYFSRRSGGPIFLDKISRGVHYFGVYCIFTNKSFESVPGVHTSYPLIPTETSNTLNSLIKVYLARPFSTCQDQPKGIGHEFLRVETSITRLGQIRLDKARLSQARLGQVRLGQVRLCPKFNLLFVVVGLRLDRVPFSRIPVQVK